MKDPKERKDADTKLNAFEIESLQGVINSLTEVLKEPKTKEETLQSLENACRELDILKWTYCKKVISLLKRGWVVD